MVYRLSYRSTSTFALGSLVQLLQAYVLEKLVNDVTKMKLKFLAAEWAKVAEPVTVNLENPGSHPVGYSKRMTQKVNLELLKFI